MGVTQSHILQKLWNSWNHGTGNIHRFAFLVLAEINDHLRNPELHVRFSQQSCWGLEAQSFCQKNGLDGAMGAGFACLPHVLNWPLNFSAPPELIENMFG